MFDLDQVQHDLKAFGFEIRRYTDWLNVQISDDVELHLMEDGSSQIELCDNHADLDADDTINLTNALNFFKNAKED